VHSQGGRSFYDDVVGAFEVTVRAMFPFFYLSFTNRGVSVAGEDMANKAGFK
jgi:hypothetical protein